MRLNVLALALLCGCGGEADPERRKIIYDFESTGALADVLYTAGNGTTAREIFQRSSFTIEVHRNVGDPVALSVTCYPEAGKACTATARISTESETLATATDGAFNDLPATANVSAWVE